MGSHLLQPRIPAQHLPPARPLLDPLPGTLPEPEIYARLLRELRAVSRGKLALLRAAAKLGRRPYAWIFAAMLATDKTLGGLAPYLLYETLGPTLPHGARSAAVLWALAHRVAKVYPAAMRRAGHRNADALFDAILTSRSGVTFTLDDYDDAWNYLPHPDKRIPLAIPQLLHALRELTTTPATHTTAEFPFVLAAGERRAFTANTIFRDDTWRRRDPHGALRLNPDDAARLGLTTGDRARITTRRGSAIATVETNDRMQPGHASLPNGLGLDLPTANGTHRTGVAANELTDLTWRDAIAGTPWHKHVPARIEPA